MAASLIEFFHGGRSDEQSNQPFVIGPSQDISVKREVLYIPGIRVAAHPQSNLFHTGLPCDFRKVANQWAGQSTGVRSEEAVAFLEIKTIKALSGQKFAGFVSIELGRVVLSVEAEKTSVASHVAFFRTVKNFKGLAQYRDDVITQRPHIAIAARRSIIEKYRSLSRSISGLARAFRYADFLFLNAKPVTKGAPQGDAERQGGCGIVQAG